MCGRITQKSNPHVLGLKIATLIEPLNEAPAPRFNGAPGQDHWIIRQHPKTGERHLDRLWWGLIPYWTKEPAPRHKPINATAERVATAPMFRAAYAMGGSGQNGGKRCQCQVSHWGRGLLLVLPVTPQCWVGSSLPTTAAAGG
jgi:putative SOS response-associated peptidase YedK